MMKILLLPFLMLSFLGSTQVLSQYTDSLQSILDSFQGATQIPGISASVYIKNQGVVQATSGESHAGTPLDTSMLLGIGSNTKLFTSVLCLKLVEQNILTLEDSLHEWLPSFTNVDPNITIRQLLQHQSGIYNFTNSAAFLPGVLNNPNTVWTPQEIMNLIGPSNFPAGTNTQYSNTNYILAGMILEAATGETYADLVKDSIITPLGLNHTFVEGFETVGGIAAHPWYLGTDYFSTPRIALGTMSWSAGCIVSKPSDLSKWYDALLNTDFLEPQSIAEITNFVSQFNLGLGIFVVSHNSKIYWGHGGRTVGYSSAILFDTDCNHSVALVINDTDGDAFIIAATIAEKMCELSTELANIEEHFDNNIQIYPNPNSKYLTIEGDTELLSVSIFDLTGKIICEIGATNQESVTINTSEFLDGIYLVSVKTKIGSVTKRITTIH